MLFVAVAFEDCVVDLIVVQGREQLLHRLFGVSLARVHVLGEGMLSILDGSLNDLSGLFMLFTQYFPSLGFLLPWAL